MDSPGHMSSSHTNPSPAEARTEFFKKLKPLCVPLSRLALRPADQGADTKEVQALLDALLNVWETEAKKEDALSSRFRQQGVLDEKLADYVFFPLSHILRSQDTYSMMAIETTIKLLTALIRHGWKNKISAELSQQLLIFLTFVVGGVPGQPRKRHVPEETILEGYRALAALVKATGSSASGSAGFLEEKMVPTLGHSVSVILDGVVEGLTPETQLAALDCLHSLYIGIKDQGALASFLPGTVSKLTHLLAPPTSLKTPTRVLVRGLHVFKTVLTTLLGDLKIRNILREIDSAQSKEDAQKTGAGTDTDTEPVRNTKVLTPAWLKATVPQIKMALSSVLKLRTHDSDNVQRAVGTLCVTLLDECHRSLEDCRYILVETAMVVYHDEGATDDASFLHSSNHGLALAQTGYNTTTGATNEGSSGYEQETSLKHLVGIYDELKDTIGAVMYSWVTGLSRVMQSSDERVKQQAIRNFIKGNKLLADFGVRSATLEDSIADALKDSVVALILNSKQSNVVNEETDENPLQALATTTAEMSTHDYRPVILAQDGQRNTRKEVHTLIESIGSPEKQANLASEMLGYLRDSEGVDQIASFWLSFELVKSASQLRSSTDDLDSFLDIPSTDDDSQEAVFHELYDFSTSIIASHSDVDEVDWRLEAIALEVTAFAAARMELKFRPELIDVLFPITTFMGSQNSQLRSHAITTLNSIAASCGYANVSELIIDNVDYMVNSLALRLNTFDVTPASTRVLNMMIRLSGPKLIPFLDDVVASIFAALDNYHGYPVFVESLFAVLSEVVEQGAKSDMLLIEGTATTKKVDHKKKPPTSEGITGLLTFLDTRKDRKASSQSGVDEDRGKGHPAEPWGPGKAKSKPKSFLETLDEITPNPDDDDSNSNQDNTQSSPQDLDKPKPPPTPTYTLLTRIATLTQHHLTSPSPTLRRSLLDLLSRAAPALAPDEDTFLPTVNAVWPTLVARLRDPEPFVVIAACDALAALCAASGDFLSTRVKTEWWDWMGKWCRKARDQAGAAAAAPGATKESKGRLLGRGSGVIEGVGKDILVPARDAGEQALVRQASSASASPSPMADMQLVQTSAPSRSTASTRTVAAASGLGRFAQSAQVWSAVVRLLTGIVSYVRIDDDIFDQVLDLLAEVVPRDERVRRALEDVNADAVWLELYRRGLVAAG